MRTAALYLLYLGTGFVVLQLVLSISGLLLIGDISWFMFVKQNGFQVPFVIVGLAIWLGVAGLLAYMQRRKKSLL